MAGLTWDVPPECDILFHGLEEVMEGVFVIEPGQTHIHILPVVVILLLHALELGDVLVAVVVEVPVGGAVVEGSLHLQ